MSWVRLSDDFGDRPELVKAGPLAFSLAVWALAYSSRHLTNGRVTFEALKGCPWVTRLSALNRACEALKVAGFWKETETGFRINDPFQYLQKAAAVKEKRRQAAARQAAWRERKRQGRNALRDALREKTVTHPPTPTPKGVGVVEPASADAAGSPHNCNCGTKNGHHGDWCEAVAR